MMDQLLCKVLVLELSRDVMKCLRGVLGLGVCGHMAVSDIQ